MGKKTPSLVSTMSRDGVAVKETKDAQSRGLLSSVAVMFRWDRFAQEIKQPSLRGGDSTIFGMDLIREGIDKWMDIIQY